MLHRYNFLKQLYDLPFIEEVWLYGSRARGDYKEYSDIDLALLCPKASSLDWLKVLDIIENADTLLKIDCIRFDTLTDNDILFKKNIMQDKTVLYKRAS